MRIEERLNTIKDEAVKDLRRAVIKLWKTWPIKMDDRKQREINIVVLNLPEGVLQMSMRNKNDTVDNI